jgi:SAM-dependent methyltransferase
LDIQTLRKNWDLFAEADPLYAVISWPEKKGRRWDEKAFFENGVQEVHRFLKYLRGQGVKLKKGKALDFGCGVGRITRALTPHFRKVTGVDLSARMIGLARRYNRSMRRCDFVLNGRPDLGSFKDGTFDFVYSSLTLQHMKPAYALSYIREFIRVLRPGGIALFQMPAFHRPRTLPGRIKKIIKAAVPGAFWAPYHAFQRLILHQPVVEMNTLGRERVVTALRRAGARVLDVRTDPNAGPEWPGYRYCVVKS